MPHTIVVDTFEQAKENAVWGTFGEGGVEHCGGACPEHQLRWVKLKDCDTNHLKLLIAQRQPGIFFGDNYKIICAILKDRGEDPSKIERVSMPTAPKYVVEGYPRTYSKGE